MNDETIKKVMQELGRRGGQKTSKAKTDATRASLAKARARLSELRSEKVDPRFREDARAIADSLETLLPPKKKTTKKKPKPTK
jgi:ElaB/YqjD/DUF883 family membrane-anchored ribosome-binding protein